MQLFLFGVGGSGARVIRSFIHLLATGATPGAVTKVVPIIIDTDSDNGDKHILLELIKSYMETRKKLYVNHEQNANANYFKVEVSNFVGSRNDAFTDLASNQKFIDWLQQEDKLKSIHLDLLHSLYDNSDMDNMELNLPLEVGYKGNPNIGSVVFNLIKDHSDYASFRDQFNAGDKIFIISSIFGGNGASGFPTLTGIIRSKKGDPKIQQSVIGALSLLPYYGISNSEKKPVDSRLFNSKAKSALDFYMGDADLNSINAHYYIGDTMRGAYAYNDGENRQKNPASVVEFIGATAIFHFCSFPDQALLLTNNKGKKYGIGLPMSNEENIHGDVDITIKHFRRNHFIQPNIIKPLLQFVFSLKYYDYIKKEGRNEFKGAIRDFEKLMLQSSQLYMTNDLDDFEKKFNEWLQQLAAPNPNGRRVFKLINEALNIENLVMDAKPISNFDTSDRNKIFIETVSKYKERENFPYYLVNGLKYVAVEMTKDARLSYTTLR